jgi:hypothetical protein
MKPTAIPTIRPAASSSAELREAFIRVHPKGGPETEEGNRLSNKVTVGGGDYNYI